MNWLHYLLEANIYLAVFYAGYCLFLNKETYYTLNRAYLLLSCFISFLLPLMQIGMLKPAEQGITTVYIVQTHLKPSVNQATSISVSPQDMLFYTYCLGVIVLVTILIFKLYKLVQMIRTANKMADDKYKIVPLEGSNTAFSFFNYLFIGSKTTGSNIIIRHEMVHIRQKHTLDVLFLEVIKIINWFNPLVYLLQNSLKTVHEYIADEQTATFESDRLSYSSFLVNNAYGLNGSSVTHSFFNYNLLKKRIIMLNQKRSGNLARLKYLVAVPICAAALCASTLGFSKTYALVDLAPQRFVADSSAKVKRQSKTQYLPPPIVIKNGYNDLFTHLNKSEKYPKTELKNKQPGLVIVAFNVGTDHKISNTQVIESTGNAFSEVVLASFQSFNGSVTDKAGEHKLAISFFTDYYRQAPQYEADIQKSGAEFNTFVIGSLGFTVPPPPPPRPESGNTPPAVKKPTYIGKQKTLPPPPPAPPVPTAEKPKEAVVKFPPPKIVKAAPKTQVVKFPPPVITKNPVERRPPPPPPQDPFDSLYRYIGKHVRYPAAARENLIAGRVIVTFNINNGKIENLKITRGLTDAMDAEVVRAIKSYDGILTVKSGKYSVPVSYSLVDQNNNYVGKAPDYKATPNDKNKPVVNDIVVESSPVLSLNEIVIVGYVNTKQ
ncbi:M56 family metallopeptidase [Mucilaginibacter lappiensis]|uniref:TonB family protein n=1 Tax=Mucilaginibacter lappiensis TaxID=354630 RepID=A0A841JJJ3_9SPHI|nr:M56 family metallopeptidase [Mucilaginibacter lappiensis]MBB6128868.1 TonB family protein [Mucilaginibacter lappiensis]